LLEGVWPGIFVDEGILTVHVAAIRRALGDSRQSPTYIETVSGSGYRFVAMLRLSAAADAVPMGRWVSFDREVLP
jgi:DNA-binding winged helix-turn-helix (wHTH) protein